MHYLVDTHIFLWSLGGDKKLKDSVRKILVDQGNKIFVSIASGWEISIKNKKGKLPLKTTLAKMFKVSGFEVLDINLDHVLALDRLPQHHHDPFDRLIIAQALVEKLVLITSDPKIKKYKVKVLI